MPQKNLLSSVIESHNKTNVDFQNIYDKEIERINYILRI